MYADVAHFLDADFPSNHQTLKTRIEKTLHVTMKWFTQNRLKLDPAKTEKVILR